MRESTHARWHKSSYSTPTGDNCVEAARLADGVGVRDSKAPAVELLLTPGQWTALIGHLRARS